MYYGLWVKRFALLVLVACGAPQGRPPPPTATPAQASRPSGPTWIGVFFDPNSATVGQVIPGSPAERAGILAGDKFETVGGLKVTSGKDVTQIVQRTPELRPLMTKIVRDGREITIDIVVELRPAIDELATKLNGKQAPALTLPMWGGGTFSLAEQRGKVVVLDFWATWCGPCIMQMPILIELQKRHPEIVVVGINAETDAALTELLGTSKPYTIARDEEQTAWRNYFVTALPTTFVLDETGIIRHVELGVGDPAAIEQAIANLRTRPSP
jgi:thiol-disulfide isomerase/thioredoxin